VVHDIGYAGTRVGADTGTRACPKTRTRVCGLRGRCGPAYAVDTGGETLYILDNPY